MKPKRLLIVGGVAGGASCAARARRLCEHCEIIMFEKGPYVSFANCGLPYHIGDVIPEEQKLLVATPDLFRDRFNVDIRTESEVVSIDREQRMLQVRNLKDGHVYSEQYDALVLSTGAGAVRPRIVGIDLPGVHILRTIPDSRMIRESIRSGGRAIVVGGGYLGLEIAENLVRRELSVTIVEAGSQLMPPLDRDMATFVRNHLEINGVEVLMDTSVDSIQPHREQGLSVALSSGDRRQADLLLIAIGVRPAASLAADAGLEMGELGGIRVDEYLRTSDPRIWAVGDVVEVRNVVTGAYQLLPLAGPANRQGRIVAGNILHTLNATSRPPAPVKFRGVQGTSVCSVFGLTVATTGSSERALRAGSVSGFEKVYLHPGNHVGYYPGAKTIHIKMIFDKHSGRVLGAQALGEAGVARRVDVFSMAIQMGATIYDLEEAELCYAPQFGATRDPVNLAGMIAANYLRGDHPLAQWDKLGDSAPADADEQDEADRLLSMILDNAAEKIQVLDVRTGAEFDRGHIQGAVNIPLDELRSRLAELSADREIWVVCGVGLRAYNATRILMQNGYNVKNLSGGMQTYNVI